MRRPYPSYRDSGVEWLGDIPEHWEVAHVRRWFAIVNGGTPASGEESYWDGETVWLTPDDLGRNPTARISDGLRTITRDGVRNSSAQICPEGSIVMSTRAPIGHLAIAAAPVTTNQGCRTLVPDHATDSSFAYYSFVASQRVLQSLGQGTTFMELTPTSLGGLPMARPPVEEQRAIAAFLDRETGKIDRLVDKKRLLIERLDDYRQTLITRTVTRSLPPEAARAAGLDPSPRLKSSGVEWLGKIPEHWELRRMNRIAHLKAGDGIPSDEIDDDGEFPVFGGNGIRGFTDRCTHEGEFVLVGRQGALCGNVHLVFGRFWASEHAVVATPTADGNASWLSHVLTAMKLNQYSYAAAQPGLAIDRISTLLVPVPPLAEQRAIAAFLDERLERIDALVASVEAAIERLAEYRAALIAAAVTGKIDVREAVPATAERVGA